jgi:predicted transcriptional regulator
MEAPGEAHEMKEQVAEIVAAYLRKNHVSTGDIPAVITQVYLSLAGLTDAQSAKPEPPAHLEPAVPIRRSVNKDFIVCLECGYKGAMLRRHLKAAHDLTPEAYRQRWSLPTDYPIVAPNYSARRSELAKANGLGKTQQPSGNRRRQVV